MWYRCKFDDVNYNLYLFSDSELHLEIINGHTIMKRSLVVSLPTLVPPDKSPEELCRVTKGRRVTNECQIRKHNEVSCYIQGTRKTGLP